MYDPAQLKKDAETIRKSGYFDADWYRATYPDVDRLGMDPAEHYLKLGALMRRDPGPEFSTSFFLNTHPGGWQKTTNPLLRFLGKNLGQMTPQERCILWAAQNVALRGQHERAIEMAEAYLPAELAHTINIMRANAELARGREEGWLSHLNAYLARFNVAPLVLKGKGALLDRFATAPLPPVTGGPLVSVIMPAFNAEATLRAAAGSILNQTWKNLELLIVDDASEDGTWPVMQEIAAADGRVKIMRNKVNVGPYVSKNIALIQAKGEWITGHDGDDWAFPDRLEQHMRAVHQCPHPPRASITYMLRLDEKGCIDTISRLSDFSPDGVIRISSISVLFEERFLTNEIGFWDSVRFGADSEMIARVRRAIGDEFQEISLIGMLCASYPESLTNHPVHGIRANNGGLSTSRKKYKKSWEDAHANMGSKSFYLPFPQTRRLYESVENMVAPIEDVYTNIRAAKIAEGRVGKVPQRFDKLSVSAVDGKFSNRLPVPGESVQNLSNFLFKHVPALVTPSVDKSFGERGREWAWRWGYWGRAAAALFLTTRDEKYLSLLDEAHDAFVAVRDDRLGIEDNVRKRVVQTWGTVITGKYDRGLRAAEVESSGLMILPWAEAIFSDRDGVIPDSVREKWIGTINEVIAVHQDELVYHPASGGGYFMSPWFDNKVEPLNHSHLLGAACALSYGICGNEEHRDIALQLYSFFKHNWRCEDGGLISWAYNPTDIDKTLGPEFTSIGDGKHKVTVGPELFYKAAVTIELPAAMYRASILPGGIDELKLISRSIRETIFLPHQQINYYISKNKLHYCSQSFQKNMPVLRPHYICGLELLGIVDKGLSRKLADLVENRPDLFPKAWLSGPASVMAAALMLARSGHEITEG